MTDDEVRAEIAKQIHEKLAEMAAKLHEASEEHGPVISKTLTIVADEIDRVA